MKLFTPAQAKHENTLRTDDDVAQIAFLSITLKKLQDSINLENSNFSERMKEQRDVYNAEKEKLQKEVKDLHKQIDIGERRLAELLIPIDGLKEQAEQTLERAQQREEEIREKEEHISELHNLLAEKIDSLSERESRIRDQEAELIKRTYGIEAERTMISDTHTKLNAELAQFRATQLSETRILEERLKSLQIREKMAQEYIDTRTLELNAKERILDDLRGVAERNLKRLSIKQ